MYKTNYHHHHEIITVEIQVFIRFANSTLVVKQT